MKKNPNTVVYNMVGGATTNKGCPDLLVCYRGWFIGIEVKADLDGQYRVTKPQEIRGRQIRQAGGYWLAVESLEEVKGFLESLDKRKD